MTIFGKKRKTVIKIIFVGFVLLLPLVWAGLITNTIKLPIENILVVDFVDDFSDNRILVGGSHNIFVGKVTGRNWLDNLNRDKRVQFEVEVLYNIKGNLSGEIVVSQLGGYKNGVLNTVHRDEVVPSDFLEIGTTYLFATRGSDNNGRYYINSHPNGVKIISEDSTLNNAELRTLAQNNEKVQVLEEAYKTEILLDVDVINNNTRNSYQSLQRGQ